MNENYLEKAYEIMQNEGKKVKKLLDNLKAKKYDDACAGLELSFIIGYENGCLMKDEENQNNIDKINKFDSDVLINRVENIVPLISFLKNNKNDVFIKGRVIGELGELSNYIANTFNISNNESEEL